MKLKYFARDQRYEIMNKTAIYLYRALHQQQVRVFIHHGVEFAQQVLCGLLEDLVRVIQVLTAEYLLV